jgi:hypothetical protein
MAMPYGWTFAVLCVGQGLLVALGWRRRWQFGMSRFVGLAVPVVALGVGVAATQRPGWAGNALALTATFGAPLAAMACAAAIGYAPLATVVLIPACFVVAWRLDGLVGDGASVIIIGAACLTLAAVLAATASQRAIAAGLVVLAVVDCFLVFRGIIAKSTANLHAITPPDAGGRPLPALQDATFGSALFGWLDLYAAALAGMLFPTDRAGRTLAGVSVGIAALTWGLLLAVTETVPGTVPVLAAVFVWLITRSPHERIAVREVRIEPANKITRR